MISALLLATKGQLTLLGYRVKIKYGKKKEEKK